MKSSMATVIVDERMPSEGIRALEVLGHRVMTLPPLPSMPKAIASHPDSLICKLEDTLVCSCELCDACPYVFTDLREYHPSLSLLFTSDEPGERYPLDAYFNALVIRDKLFVNTKNASQALLDKAREYGKKIIHTNQGYPACATLALPTAHAVTADPGLGRVLSENGIKVLLIESDHISLPPYKYGFIGGACGVIGNTVYFFGDPESHPDGARIKEFLSGAGYAVKSLFAGGLIDLGGMTVIENSTK